MIVIKYCLADTFFYTPINILKKCHIYDFIIVFWLKYIGSKSVNVTDITFPHNINHRNI